MNHTLLIILSTIILTFAQKNEGSIEGTVINDKNEVIADVAIQINPGHFSDITDIDGHFIIKNIPDGNYQIKLEHVAYQTELISDVSVSKSQLTSLDTIQLRNRILTFDEFIITADRIEQDPFDTPNAINIVSQGKIAERESKTSAEALREETGIFVQKTNHGGGSAIIRGLSSNQILILVDGIRLNNSLYRLGNHQYLTTIDNNSIKQIEVVRGPTSTLYGSDAMGGTINLRTQLPESTTSNFTSNFSFSSRYASADDEKTGSLRSEFSIHRLAFNAGFSYKDYGDMKRGRNSDYKRIENSTNGIIQSPNSYTTFDFDSKLIFQLSEQGNLIAAYQFSDQEKVPRYDKYENDDYYLWQYQPQKRQLVYIKFQQNLSLKYIHSFIATVSYNDQIEGRQTQRRVDSSLQKEKDEARTIGLSLESNSLFRNHNFIYGAEMYFDRIKSESFDIEAISGLKTKNTVSRYPDGAEYNSCGLYLQDEYTWFRNLTTTIGCRYSYFYTQFQALGIDPVLFENDDNFDQSFSSLTFSLGTVYQMTDYFHFNFNYGQAFRAPNLSDISKFGESKGEIFEIPNPDLKPEKMSTIDVGFKINQSSLKMDGSLYYSKISDLLASANASYNGSPTILIDSTEFNVKSKQNIGKAYIYGIEGSFRYIVNNHWHIRGNATWTYGENITLDEPVGGIPPLFGLFGIQHNHNKYKSDLYMRFATKQDRLSVDDLDDPRIPKGGTPSWQIYNFRLQYQVTSFLSAQFTLENILDYNYREHGSGINGPGRNYIISIHVNI